MPPRYTYWTIIAGGLPTAFRAAEREDLLPTLKRLAATHPDAEMKWFARGRLWSSPEAARDARPKATGRGPDWRPGGEHRDPRQAFKDAKQARNQARRERRFARNQRQAGGTEAGPVRSRPAAGPGRRRPGARPAGPAGPGGAHGRKGKGGRRR